MNCQRIDTVLDSHAIGALSAADRAEIASHLEGCRRCADAWLSHEMLQGETPEPPAAGLYDRVLAATVDGTGAARHRRSTIGLAAAAGLVAFVFAGLWLTERDAPQPQPEVVNASAESSTPRVAGNTPRVERAVPRYVAGIDYQRLSSPAPTSAAAGQVEVCEFFMWGCIHCYDFEPALTAWVESRSDAIDFVRVPAMFNDLARLHAQAFYTAEALGKLDTLIEPFYEELHVRGNALASVAAIREFFGRVGIDGQRFDEAFASAGVRARMTQAEELNRRYRVNATPSIGINGRYLTNASMAGSNEALLTLVDALVEAEAEVVEQPCADRDRCAQQRPAAQRSRASR